MMSNAYSMDEIDQKIVQLIQRKPNLTHTEIANHVSRSQPTVGMRIRKLEEAGILNFHAGINLKDVDLYLAMVWISTSNPEKTITLVNECPSLVNAFRLSGEFNVVVMVASFNIKDIDNIVNKHFRNDEEISDVRMELITEVNDDYILPLNILYEECNCQ
ncbi:MAG: Lrp/AsnC family transcriptional regulator [Promethearchaeota archaeon]